MDKGTGNKSQYFYLETSKTSFGLCEQLLSSALIQPDVVSVNGQDDAECDETGDNIIRFYFDYNPGEKPTWTDRQGMIHNCNKGASACDKKGRTTSCKEGLYLSGEDCLFCPAHMVTCTNPHAATRCEDGYYLLNGACLKCPDHMLTCADAETALSCETGYYLHDGGCEPCPEHSTACDNNGIPTTCTNGYWLNEGECVACAPHATNCGGLDEAFDCESGYNLVNGKCQSCTTEDNFMGTDSKCYPCSYANMPVAEASECHLCPERYRNTAGKCYLCSNVNIQSAEPEECHRCADHYSGNDGKCYSCTEAVDNRVATTSECLRCSNRYRAGDGKCIRCTNSGNISTTANECHRCPNRYRTADGYCRLCSNGTLTTADEAECHRCDGRLRATNGTCYFCPSTAGTYYATTEAECHDRCPEALFNGSGRCYNILTQAIPINMKSDTFDAYAECANHPNRTIIGTGHTGERTAYCAKNCTGEGQFLNSNGTCSNCNSTTVYQGWIAGRNLPESGFWPVVNACMECPDLIPTSENNGYCRRCEDATQAIAMLTPSHGNGITVKKMAEQCNKCENRTFVWNCRSTQGGEYKCAKTCTGAGQFLDADGVCQSCSSAKVYMGWQANRSQQYCIYNTVRAHCLACPGMLPLQPNSNDSCYQCNNSTATFNAYNADCISQCKGVRYVSATNKCTLCPANLASSSLNATQKSQCCPVGQSWCAASNTCAETC